MGTVFDLKLQWKVVCLRTYCRVSSESMRSMGNAFVACGVVYSIDSYSATTTTINYAYDTTKKSGTNPSIKFVNKFDYNSMVTYNPRERTTLVI